MGVRALKNIMLMMMARHKLHLNWLMSNTKTQVTCLRCITCTSLAKCASSEASDFYNRFKDEALSLDQWFMQPIQMRQQKQSSI